MKIQIVQGDITKQTDVEAIMRQIPVFLVAAVWMERSTGQPDRNY